MTDTGDRQELRRKLRDKIRSKRASQSISNQRMHAQCDVERMVLSLENPQVMQAAADVIRTAKIPDSVQENLKTHAPLVPQMTTTAVDEDAEEAPPPE